MSDANKQSVERCQYRHDWVRVEEGYKLAPDGYICRTCNYAPKRDSKLWHEAESIVHLQKILKPGDTIYTVLRHVSRSGMSRNVDMYYISDGNAMWISAYVGHAIGTPQSRKNWERSQGLTVGGCGMDVGFELVYNLGRVLWPHGFECSGKSCPSNDHSNEPRKFDRETFKGQMHTGDGGYALNHRWL